MVIIDDDNIYFVSKIDSFSVIKDNLSSIVFIKCGLQEYKFTLKYKTSKEVYNFIMEAINEENVSQHHVVIDINKFRKD
ncbi:hypothetical protein [Campylobacter phage CP81]|uniref:Uncharacterized protein n=1 Tax=Campylobacter phage CP81 TaxID=2927008 RepID=G0LWM3_9CAUD|nr:hypothetical protein FDJ37_gp048 [Campylobacter phage CP81]CBZ42215.1 hypothetical protein [Campylobacter phage CP81]